MKARNPLESDDERDVFPIHPYQAAKRYTCPWCNGPIEPGIGHVVVVPRLTPEDRRHWHKGCWHKSRRGVIDG